MAVKTSTTKMSDAEIRYVRKVKSMELAIRATVGKNGAMTATIVKAAKEIYDYLNED